MRIGHASIDENKNIKNGRAGDQTGKEVCIRTYYDKNWDFVLRPKSPEMAEREAKACEALCANNHIGYDQNERNNLIKDLEALNWNYNAITKDTECDCSSLMTACALCAGAKINYKVNAPHTKSMKTRFKESGDYTVIQFVSPKHTNLQRGDILVKEGSHTVMVLDDYAKTTTVNVTSKPILKQGDRGDWVKVAQARLVVNGLLTESDIDGDFGPKTKKAVLRYQAMKNIKTSGVIDGDTWAKLYP